MRENEFSDVGVNHLSPAPATKDAVVPRARDFQVSHLRGFNACAQALGRLGLSRARDVVKLALDGQKGSAFDVLWSHTLHLAIQRLHVPRPFDQAHVLENDLDGFKVIIGVHIKHGIVFIIESAVIVGVGIVAFDQIFKEIVVAL